MRFVIVEGHYFTKCCISAVFTAQSRLKWFTEAVCVPVSCYFPGNDSLINLNKICVYAYVSV